MEKTDQLFWDICIFGQLLERGYNETSLKKLFFEMHKELPAASIAVWDKINMHKNQKNNFVKDQDFTRASEQMLYENESKREMYAVLTGIKEETVTEEIKVAIWEHWQMFTLFFPVISK